MKRPPMMNAKPPTPEAKPESEPSAGESPAPRQIKLVELTLPLLVTGQHQNIYVECQLANDALAKRGLRALLDGLHEGHWKLGEGRHVDTASDAVRWLLREIGRKAAADELS